MSKMTDPGLLSPPSYLLIGNPNNVAETQFVSPTHFFEEIRFWKENNLRVLNDVFYDPSWRLHISVVCKLFLIRYEYIFISVNSIFLLSAAVSVDTAY